MLTAFLSAAVNIALLSRWSRPIHSGNHECPTRSVRLNISWNKSLKSTRDSIATEPGLPLSAGTADTIKLALCKALISNFGFSYHKLR
jgi:hypothetical protein